MTDVACQDGGRPRVVVAGGPEDVAKAACRVVLECARDAIADHGLFRIALAGGSTPRRLYELLAASPDADFTHWRFFFGDERWKPPGHPELNATMARDALFGPAGIDPARVHVMDTTAGSPQKCARLYSLEVRRALAPSPGEMPSFDLVLLGLGADGHTASLFPESSALLAGPREVAVATWAASQHCWRVTLTVAAINAARRVVFVVRGPDKAGALARVVDGDALHLPPAARIRPAAGLPLFLVDEDAASGLKT